MDEDGAVRKVLALGVDEPGVLFIIVKAMNWTKIIWIFFKDWSNPMLFAWSIKQKVRRRILDYYAEHVFGEDLDQYLKQMDYGNTPVWTGRSFWWSL